MGRKAVNGSEAPGDELPGRRRARAEREAAAAVRTEWRSIRADLRGRSEDSTARRRRARRLLLRGALLEAKLGSVIDEVVLAGVAHEYLATLSAPGTVDTIRALEANRIAGESAHRQRRMRAHDYEIRFSSAPSPTVCGALKSAEWSWKRADGIWIGDDLSTDLERVVLASGGVIERVERDRSRYASSRFGVGADMGSPTTSMSTAHANA
jgi:hypothetical protein